MSERSPAGAALPLDPSMGKAREGQRADATSRRWHAYPYACAFGYSYGYGYGSNESG